MAVSYIGVSNLIAVSAAPGAITVNAGTAEGDLLVAYHYSRGTGGNETVSPPAGWSTIFNSVTANFGLVAVFWRVRQAGDTTYTFTVTNHTTGTSGETILQWIETYRGQAETPITKFTAALSTWASSLTMGPIAAPATAAVIDGGMAIVFAGRFENLTAQTLLTGHSLTWSLGTLNNTTQGLDAAAVTQRGLNASGVTQTITAKSITTTGTAQAGAGRMFIIEPQPVFNVSGSPSIPLITVSGELDFTLANNDRDISGSFSVPQIIASGSITNTDPVYNLSGSPSIPAILVSGVIGNTDPVYAISGSISIDITASGEIENTQPIYDLSGEDSLPNLFIDGNVDFNLLSAIDVSGDFSLHQLIVSGSVNNGNSMGGDIMMPVFISGELKNNEKIFVVSTIHSLSNCNTVATPTQIIINTRVDLSEATLPKIKYIRPDSVSGFFEATISGSSLISNLSDTDVVTPGKWVFYASVTLDNVEKTGEKKIIKFI